MSALQALKRTQPAPSPHAVRGIKPQRVKKTKGKAAARAQRKRSKPLASQKPRTHKNQQRKVSALTYEQLIQEVLFLRGHVAALVKENEAMKALLPVSHKQVPLPLLPRKKAA